ncbi:nuclear transport factor 2 family protein [uncultured Draconibacterium sp.]|uniref:YybH family protein n=1 Tax=uncultured Draconibacterium sp. TaxID=1573823 RepID=UPI002AA7CB85|nr:nuclear transport factor 2 family protein [uncultured Draconibacterium sp.]
MKVSKSILIWLCVIVLLSCNRSNLTNSTDETINESLVKHEVQQLIDNMVKLTYEKDIDELMKLYENSADFKLISAPDEVLSYTQLYELYRTLFDQLEKQKIIESTTTVYPLSNNKALCVWAGQEEMKMEGMEAFQSSWISTILLEKQDGNWLIIHMHNSHK